MELTEAQKEDLRTILEGFYGTHTVANWKMSDRLLQPTAELLNAAAQCSKALGLVPRPKDNLAGYLVRQLREIATNMKSGARYEVCNVIRKWQMKTRIEAAAQGL